MSHSLPARFTKQNRSFRDAGVQAVRKLSLTNRDAVPSYFQLRWLAHKTTFIKLFAMIQESGQLVNDSMKRRQSLEVKGLTLEEREENANLKVEIDKNIEATASNNYSFIGNLMHKTVREPLISSNKEIFLQLGQVTDLGRMIIKTTVAIKGNSNFALVEDIHAFLKEQLKDLIYSEREYDEVFTRFEIIYLMAMMPNTVSETEIKDSFQKLPLGRFKIYKFDRLNRNTVEIMQNELKNQMSAWPLLKHLFGNDSTESVELATLKLRMLQQLLTQS